MYFWSLNKNSMQYSQIMLEFIWSLMLYLIEGQDNVLLLDENFTYQLLGFLNISREIHLEF